MDTQNPIRYWKSLGEREAPDESRQDEFPELLDFPETQINRRGFLKAAGFTVAAGALAGCSPAPVQKAIPYLVQPEEIIPGRANFYASTCAGCSAGCGTLVKTRDGRPIKLEGNPQHPMSRGGLCAVGQATLLGLYDSQRLKGPLAAGRPETWEGIDREILAKLAEIRANRGAVRFLSGTITSPTTQALIQEFLAQFSDGRHVVYDPLSCSAILEAHEQTHGARVLPRFRFKQAEVIASFDADFLGTWISPVEFAQGYRAGRALEATPPRFSYHVQFESRMSLTGTKADRRVVGAPSEIGLLLTLLGARIAELAGASFDVPPVQPPVAAGLMKDLATRLWQSRGRSLVVSGSQDVRAQVLANFINHLLGNYGSTIDLEKPSHQKQGNDYELENLIGELNAGKVSAVFLHGANPVYELPGGAAFAEALKRVPLVVSTAERADETSALAHFICPDHHFLESWNDAEATAGLISLSQPAIHPLGKTRSVLESFAAWSGNRRTAYDILREHWRASVFPRHKREASFEAFWDRSVHDGLTEIEVKPEKIGAFHTSAVRPVTQLAAPSPGAFALVLYPKVSQFDGRHAHNPWLQELPDPITKVAWDNYASISPAAAERLGVAEGDVVRLEIHRNDGSNAVVELPAYLQPGQHEQTVAVALGYGRKGTERFARIGPQWLFGKPGGGEDGRIGKNAAPLLELSEGRLQFSGMEVHLTKTGRRSPLACSQSHHSLTTPRSLPIVGNQEREIVRETTWPAILKAQPAQRSKNAPAEQEDLWPADHPTPNHRWGMAIDLTACTGCSACVIACQAENNIAVVGKDEVLRHREMHWLRIDRYYSGAEEEVETVHQPMLCQQCGNAPCETVCPVLATVHSDEGLNQQVYNRCVGTRYCANNCPYKTRRFNWFDYSRDDRLANLALNPDVTVRSRGVMEKCTFCVQRIQEAKIEAKRQGKALVDGDIQTACQQTCPSQAILFGDLNDPQSRISKSRRNPRNYHVLGEFNFRPAVGYLELVRNRPEGEEKNSRG